MKYSKMECGILEPVLRTIFFNPDDTNEINSLIKSDDIKKVFSKYIPIGKCIITHDVKIENSFQFGYCNGDILNDEFTCIATQYFV